LADVNDSVVNGLAGSLELWPNTFYPFSVTGAGSDNTNPGNGDTCWRPVYWMQEGGSTKQTSWKIGSKNGIYTVKTLPIRIYLEKYVYQDGTWVASGEQQYISYTIQTADLSSATTTPSADGTTGYDAGTTDTTALATTVNEDGTTGESTSAAGAQTGDESPIGTMMMLAMASMLAGGYVIVRRRKKEF
jgi:LPXTG-motif cell wall-anchored protein